MAISMRRYVDITSGVAAGAGVRKRDLILRIVTSNAMIPINAIVTLENVDDALALFGSDSEEYKRCLAYFGWASKNQTSPKKISFARYSDGPVLPYIIGNRKNTAGFSQLQQVTNGDLIFVIDGVEVPVEGIDLSETIGMSDVAAMISSAIVADGENIPAMETSSTAFDAQRGAFVWFGGATVTLKIKPGTNQDLAILLGWLDGAVVSDGSNGQSLVEVISESTSADNNFASLVVMNVPASDPRALEVAQWVDAQNNMYMYCLRAETKTEAGDAFEAMSGLSGVAVTYAPLSTEFPEQIPATVLAATDYGRPDATQNYMFQVFDMTPSVADNASADLLDGARANYYGRTQTAGQKIDFYQRGIMMGLPTDAVDQNTYANEIWLKDTAAASILELFLSLPKISANAVGRSQLIGALQANVIGPGLLNGVISIGKRLDQKQKIFITSATTDPLAWHQVQNSGFWLDVSMVKYVTQDGREEWKAVYLLIYSKDDVIRKVEGTHSLI